MRNHSGFKPDGDTLTAQYLVDFSWFDDEVFQFDVAREQSNFHLLLIEAEHKVFQCFL